MFAGSCLCGAVRYEIVGDIGEATLCHCRTCRKAQGTAYVAAAPVEASRFRLVRGAETVKEFESSPGKFRAFCAVCGSPMYSRRAGDPGTVRIRLGTLDTALTRRPIAHIWVSDKAGWEEIGDAIPQYPGFEPTRAAGK